MRRGRDLPPLLVERDHVLAPLAQRWGLTFLPTYPAGDPHQIFELPFRWMAPPLEISNVLAGNYRGTNVVAFDFAGSVLGPGNSYSTVSADAVAASCAFTVLQCAFPAVTILPRGAQGYLRRWQRIGSVRFGRSFDRMFRIKTEDRDFARLLLSTEMRRLLLGPTQDGAWLHPDEGGAVVIEVRDRWIVCTSRLLEPTHIKRSLLDPLVTFAEDVRDRLMRSYPARPVSRS